MRILLVEDESKTASYLRKGLTESGFTVHHCADGEDGLHHATNHTFDLIILDVMLPKLDGWSLLTEIRRIHPTIRVLFLTARDAIDDKVKGLELGADDYLVKPFSFSELLARIKNLLRRKTNDANDQLSLADLTVDLTKQKAHRGNVRLNLSQKEFKLLVFLLQHTGQILSRTLIAEAVWDINFESDTNAVDVAVRRLRQKIDDPFDKKLIHTARGMGYVLEEV